MARKLQDYWEERNTKMMLRYEKMTEDTINTLVKAYNKALENISKEIAKTFNNYAKDGVLTNEKLKVLLNKKQSDLYHDSLLKIINTIDDSEIKKRILAKYNAPAYAFRISRYEQLRSAIDVELKKLAAIEKKVNQDTYESIINDGYYRTVYEIQKGTSLGFSFSEIDTKTVKMMLSEKWIDKANFSERIWKNSEKLSDYISTNLLASNISGKSIQKISKELSEAMNVGLYNATTLIRTEVNHFANESEMLAYEECEIEKYRFIATLDKITCDHCGELDNKVFDVKDRKAGKNYPPIHPNDRCTTVAEFDDDVMEKLTRRARDKNGNSITVPQDISYKKWLIEHNSDKEISSNILEAPLQIDKLNNIISSDKLTIKAKNYLNKNLNDDNVRIDYNNKKPIFYNIDEDKIIINPNHPQINEYDKIRTLIHETTHMLDVNNNISIDLRIDISEAIEETNKILLDEKYLDILIKYEDNMSISDIFSCVTDNKMYGNFYHSNEYWEAIGHKEREMIANLYTEYIIEDEESLNFINSILPLKNLLRKVVELYEHI